MDITEDWSAIRIPSATGYADNYVTGMRFPSSFLSSTSEMPLLPAAGGAVATKVLSASHSTLEAGTGQCGVADIEAGPCDPEHACHLACAMHRPGMGVDLTSVGVEVESPDPEAPPLPPAPLLLVATSDGALRLFTFSHAQRPTEGLVAPPLPLSAAVPTLAQPPAAEQASAWTAPAHARSLCYWTPWMRLGLPCRRGLLFTG